MNRGLYKTNIEIIMCEALEKEEIKVVPEYPIRGSYIIDFAIPKLKIAIECDGKKWHPRGNIKDRNKNYWLKKKGWKVLRFTDKEIKNNINDCIRIIKEVKYDKNKSKSEGCCTIVNESILC